jgi:hypothetical protein
MRIEQTSVESQKPRERKHIFFSKSLSQNETSVKVPGYSQSLCGDPNFQSPIGGIVLVVVDVAVIWIKSPHNALVASLTDRLNSSD